MPKNEEGRWITTETGTHVFIKNGETVEQAMQRQFKDFGGKDPDIGLHEVYKSGGTRKEAHEYMEKILGENYDPMQVDGDLGEFEREHKYGIYAKDTDDEEESAFDKYNSLRQGKQPKEKKPLSLKQRWDRYLKNAFSGSRTDYWNKELNKIEGLMPFKDQEEHDKWLDMLSTWNGEQEFEDFTNEILSRPLERDEDYERSWGPVKDEDYDLDDESDSETSFNKYNKKRLGQDSDLPF